MPIHDGSTRPAPWWAGWSFARWITVLGAALAVNAASLAGAGFSPWWHVLGAAVGNVVQLVVVAVLAGWAAVRHAPDGAVRPLARHLVTAALATAAALALSYGGRHLPHSAAAHHPAGPGPGVGFLAWWFVFFYAAVAALAHAAQAQARLRAREREAVHAELRAARAQLDSHFLFNALHSVGVLVRHAPDDAEDAVERLGDLLRYVLRAGRTDNAAEGRIGEVSLAEEIAFVRDYLAVERIRFGARLRVEEAIAPDVLRGRVPPLLLQPIVENAVKHAVGSRRDGATVWLLADRVHDSVVGDGLRIRVFDDGPGLSDARPRGDRHRGAGMGIGLDALRRRLANGYGERHRLEIAAPPSGGFGVSVVLPWRPAAGDAAVVDATASHVWVEVPRWARGDAVA
jgi:signal transduction histidine kinase